MSISSEMATATLLIRQRLRAGKVSFNEMAAFIDMVGSFTEMTGRMEQLLPNEDAARIEQVLQENPDIVDIRKYFPANVEIARPCPDPA